MKVLKQFEKEVSKIDTQRIPNPGEVIDGFKTYWPVLRALLVFVKVFTGSATDEKIDQIITWGDSI